MYYLRFKTDLTASLNSQSDTMATTSGLPNIIGFPTAAPVVEQSGWATKQDWDKHRALIGQLYEKKKLSQVMDFMAKRHGFRATFVSRMITLTLIPTEDL